MDEMKVTLIGGSGFVGQRLCCVLNEAAIEFEILDIEKPERFEERYEYCDIGNKADLIKLITGSVVINLAAAHRDDLPDKSEYYTVNVEGSRNLLEACEILNIRHVIFLSSVAVYGFTDKPLEEGAPLNPFNDYGRSKKKAEFLYKNFYERDTTRITTIIRPTVIFGEGNRGNVFNLFSQINSGFFFMVGSGTNSKSMAYVGNVAGFILHSIKESSGYEVSNYTDAPDLTVGELVDIVHSYFGRKLSKFYLPTSLGLAIGRFLDRIASIMKFSSPVSEIRIKKFTENTQFFSTSSLRETFRQEYALRDAVIATLRAEFHR